MNAFRFSGPFTGSFEDFIEIIAAVTDIPTSIVRAAYSIDKLEFEDMRAQSLSITQMISRLAQGAMSRGSKRDKTAGLTLDFLAELLQEAHSGGNRKDGHTGKSDCPVCNMKTKAVTIFAPGIVGTKYFEIGAGMVKRINVSWNDEARETQVNIYFEDGSQEVFVGLPYSLKGVPAKPEGQEGKKKPSSWDERLRAQRENKAAAKEKSASENGVSDDDLN